jgi:hypothetical protein
LVRGGLGGGNSSSKDLGVSSGQRLKREGGGETGGLLQQTLLELVLVHGASYVTSSYVKSSSLDRSKPN